MKHNPKTEAARKVLLVLRTQAAERRAQEALEEGMSIMWTQYCADTGFRTCDVASPEYREMVRFLSDKIAIKISNCKGLCFPLHWLCRVQCVTE